MHRYFLLCPLFYPSFALSHYKRILMHHNLTPFHTYPSIFHSLCLDIQPAGLSLFYFSCLFLPSLMSSLSISLCAHTPTHINTYIYIYIYIYIYYSKVQLHFGTQTHTHTHTHTHIYIYIWGRNRNRKVIWFNPPFSKLR